mgnify:CR=1 FL=1
MTLKWLSWRAGECRLSAYQSLGQYDMCQFLLRICRVRTLMYRNEVLLRALRMYPALTTSSLENPPSHVTINNSRGRLPKIALSV